MVAFDKRHTGLCVCRVAVHSAPQAWLQDATGELYTRKRLQDVTAELYTRKRQRVGDLKCTRAYNAESRVLLG